MTDSELFKERILMLLKLESSEQKPIRSKEMQYRWNISDITVRQAVGLLRDDCHPIASGPKGFFYATTAKQLNSTIKDLNGRLTVISKRCKKLQDAQERMMSGDDGQRLLDL
tara:strand:+ start:196 stop:531 length:336 start_codon:yes stop_codon:yes gene_type:complete